MKGLGNDIVAGFKVLKRDGLRRLLRLALIRFIILACKAYDFVRGANNTYNPYDNLAMLKPILTTVVDVDYEPASLTTSFSLISTIKNESSNIIRFLKSIESQSLRPDEIIIVDGGSDDNTLDLIKDYLVDSSLVVSIIQEQKINVAEGRNIALAACSNEIVVLTDAGCWLDEHFCRNLVGLFERFPDADLAGGIWTPAVKTRWNLFMPFWEDLNWESFLPSARAMAVKKSLCAEIGGFPEYLPLTGEDTLFDINYRRISKRWVFNRKAFVYWQAPTTKEREQRVAFNYAKGDGESGVGDFFFYPLVKKSLSVLKFAHISPQACAGYLEGRLNRSFVEITRRNISGLVLILSCAPFTDSGGCLRGTELAIEFISRNYKVIFVNVYSGGKETTKQFFPIDYSLLELYGLADFDSEELAVRYRDLSGGLIILSEFPHQDFIPVIDHLKKEFKKCTYIFDSTEQCSVDVILAICNKCPGDRL